MLEVRVMSLDSLSTYVRNPRRGDVDAIATSLQARGQYKPIVVNVGTLTGRPMEILAGNHTFLAARELGWESLEAVTLDVDDVVAAQIVAADNRLADLGSYDVETLLAALHDVDVEALASVGFDVLDVVRMERELAGPAVDAPGGSSGLIRVSVSLTSDEKDLLDAAMRCARERGGLDAGNRNGAALAAVARAALGR